MLLGAVKWSDKSQVGTFARELSQRLVFLWIIGAGSDWGLDNMKRMLCLYFTTHASKLINFNNFGFDDNILLHFRPDIDFCHKYQEEISSIKVTLLVKFPDIQNHSSGMFSVTYMQ